MTPFESIADRRVLVTGSGGFLGGYVVAALKRARAQVFEIGSRRECDLREREAVTERLKQVRPEVVIHLAATADPPGRALSTDGFDNTVLATANLVHALPRDRACLFVHAGSYKQYGAIATPFLETCEPQPCCPYGHAKNLSEQIVRGALGGGLEAVFLRLGYIYGPWQPRTSLVPAAIHALREGGSFAAADTIWDAVYVEDAAAAILQAAVARAGRGLVINVSCGIPHTPLDVIRTLAELMDVKLEEGRIVARPAPPSQLFGCIERAGRCLGWEPRISLREGLWRCLDAALDEAGAARPQAVQQ
jgi:nucleoside-diphosphate-sugar epimerase